MTAPVTGQVSARTLERTIGRVYWMPGVGFVRVISGQAGNSNFFDFETYPPAVDGDAHTFAGYYGWPLEEANIARKNLPHVYHVTQEHAAVTFGDDEPDGVAHVLVRYTRTEGTPL